jgi:hypothetical protein
MFNISCMALVDGERVITAHNRAGIDPGSQVRMWKIGKDDGGRRAGPAVRLIGLGTCEYEIPINGYIRHIAATSTYWACVTDEEIIIRTILK